MKKIIFSILFLIVTTILYSQNYQAINGSNYGGSLQVTSNPASILHSPFSFDVTPVAIQFKNTTNTYKLYGGSYLKNPFNIDSVSYTVGDKKRYVAANANIQLLNTRIRITNKAAIAFGFNVHGNAFAKTSKINLATSSYENLKEIALDNINNTPLSAKGSGAVWAEFFGSYAHNILDQTGEVLNVGGTIRVGRGFMGGYGNIDNATLNPTVVSSVTTDVAVQVSAIESGFASNNSYISDLPVSATSTEINEAINDFLRYSRIAMSIDLGAEYIIPATKMDEPDNLYAYDTKIGVSIMDIGFIRFNYGDNSYVASKKKSSTSASTIDQKFSGTDYRNIDDSVATIADEYESLNTLRMDMLKPMRIVVNVDKYLGYNVYLNGELSLPISQFLKPNGLVLRDMNLLAITPRFENRLFGVYLPMTLSNQMKFMVGAAFKAGPVLIGFHNLGNILGKNKLQNGGGYFALTLRPWKKKYDESKRKWYSSNIGEGTWRSLRCKATESVLERQIKEAKPTSNFY